MTFIDGSGSLTRNGYYELNRQTDTYYCNGNLYDTCADVEPGIHKTGTEYDFADNMMANVDENGVRTAYDYDMAGRRMVSLLKQNIQMAKTET